MAKMTRQDESTVLMFTSYSHKLSSYVYQTAGTARTEIQFPHCQDGHTALQQLIEVEPALAIPASRSPLNYHEIFHNGISIDLLSKKQSALQNYNNDQLAEIFYSLLQFLKWPLKYLSRSEYHVCAKLQEQKIRFIYITPRTEYSKQALLAWQTRIHMENLNDLIV